MQDNIQHLFILAQKNDRKSQKVIFDFFAPKMLAISKSYVGNVQDAEDVIIESFYKAFMKINECKKAESFQYWLRKIVVNDSIAFIRRNSKLLYVDEFNEELYGETIDETIENAPEIQLDEILSEMPLGYKMVFNLYVFEEKKHQEIAEILNISQGTSKSQLNKAKRWLVDYLKKNSNEQLAEK